MNDIAKVIWPEFFNLGDFAHLGLTSKSWAQLFRAILPDFICKHLGYIERSKIRAIILRAIAAGRIDIIWYIWPKISDGARFEIIRASCKRGSDELVWEIMQIGVNIYFIFEWAIHYKRTEIIWAINKKKPLSDLLYIDSEENYGIFQEYLKVKYYLLEPGKIKYNTFYWAQRLVARNLEFDKDLAYVDQLSIESLLQIAVRNKNLDFIKYCLNLRPNIEIDDLCIILMNNFINDEEIIQLLLIQYEGSIGINFIFGLLISTGNLNKVENFDTTAIDTEMLIFGMNIARQYRHFHIINYLIKIGAQPYYGMSGACIIGDLAQFKKISGEYPSLDDFHFAIGRSNNVEFFKYLENQYEINITGPLIEGALFNYGDLFRYLWQKYEVVKNHPRIKVTLALFSTYKVFKQFVKDTGYLPKIEKMYELDKYHYYLRLKGMG